MINNKLGKFTLICNNCGEKTEIIQSNNLLYEDDNKQHYSRDIKQNGKININIDYRYEILEIKCNNCGQLITNEPLEVNLER